MDKKERWGSWSVLWAQIISVLGTLKLFGKRVPILITPSIIFIKFVTRRYQDEIENFAKWVRSRLRPRRSRYGESLA